jgi:hypothetical protein
MLHNLRKKVSALTHKEAQQNTKVSLHRSRRFCIVLLLSWCSRRLFLLGFGVLLQIECSRTLPTLQWRPLLSCAPLYSCAQDVAFDEEKKKFIAHADTVAKLAQTISFSCTNMQKLVIIQGDAFLAFGPLFADSTATGSPFNALATAAAKEGKALPTCAKTASAVRKGEELQKKMQHIDGGLTKIREEIVRSLANSMLLFVPTLVVLIQVARDKSATELDYYVAKMHKLQEEKKKAKGSVKRELADCQQFVLKFDLLARRPEKPADAERFQRNEKKLSEAQAVFDKVSFGVR